MPTPNTAAEIGREVVERMVALVRDLHADHVKHGAHDYVQDFVARTAAIVAELPVDPLLIEARALCIAVVADIDDAGGLKSSAMLWTEKYYSGRCDNHKDVQKIYAALKARAVGEGDGRG